MNAVSIKSILNKQLTINDIQTLVNDRWSSGDIADTIDLSIMPNKTDYESIPWIKVDCMQTKLIDKSSDGIGFGLDIFAPAAKKSRTCMFMPKVIELHLF